MLKIEAKFISNYIRLRIIQQLIYLKKIIMFLMIVIKIQKKPLKISILTKIYQETK